MFFTQIWRHLGHSITPKDQLTNVTKKEKQIFNYIKFAFGKSKRMQADFRLITVTVMGIISSLSLSAKEFENAVGQISSPKEFGLVYILSNSDTGVSNSFKVTADMLDILRGKYKSPGFRFSYNMNYSVKTWTRPSGTRVCFYSGPGLSVGYLRDLSRGKGLVVALCGECGFFMKFEKAVFVKLGIQGEFGLHIMKSDSDTKVNMYKNGLASALIPQLSIGYCF